MSHDTLLTQYREAGLLDKFAPAVQADIEALISQWGSAVQNVLQRHDETLALAADDSVLRHIAQRQPITTTVIDALAVANTEEVVDWIHAHHNDLHKAVAAVETLPLPTLLQDPRVPPLRAQLVSELATYTPQFSGQKIMGAVSGSFHFGDPSDQPDLDFDFIVESTDTLTDDIEQIPDELESALGIPLEMHYLVLRDIEKQLQDACNRPEMLAPEDWKVLALECSLLMTAGKLELPEADTDGIVTAVEHAKQQIVATAEKNELFRVLLFCRLKNSVDDRQQKYRTHRIQPSS